MAIGISNDTRMVWRSVRAADAWCSVVQMTHYWRPTFTEAEMLQHLDNLWERGFLEWQERPVFGGRTVRAYRFTPACTVLPGEEPAATVIPSAIAAEQVAHLH